MRPPKSPTHEHLVHGEDIGLPLIETLGAIRSHSASRITWHSHRMFELLFVLDGATAYEFPGRAPIELPGGHFLVVPPRTSHRGLHNVRMPAMLCGIVFDPTRAGARRNTPFTGAELKWMVAQFRQSALAVRPLGRELPRLVAGLGQQISSFAKRGEILGCAKLRLTVCAVLLEAARQLTQLDKTDSRKIADAAIAHMQARLHEPLSVAALARHVGYGRARFFQLFKAATGMAPNDYLQRLRVGAAREWLARTTRSVTDIALATGFSSSQYFSSVFRKYTGLTPGNFRRQGAGGRTKPLPSPAPRQ